MDKMNKHNDPEFDLDKYIQTQNAVVLLQMGYISWFRFFEIIREIHKVVIVLFVIGLMGCGTGSTDPQGANVPPVKITIACSMLEGVYDNQIHSGHTAMITNTCQFTDSLCGYTGSFTNPDANTGETVLTILGTNGTPGCMSSTAHTCRMQIVGNQLGVACDNDTQLFSLLKR